MRFNLSQHEMNIAQYRKSDLCIPRKETVRPRSRLHSCICERFIYSQNLSAYLAAAKIGRPILEYITHRYMIVEIGRENIKILFWK